MRFYCCYYRCYYRYWQKELCLCVSRVPHRQLPKGVLGWYTDRAVDDNPITPSARVPRAQTATSAVAVSGDRGALASKAAHIHSRTMQTLKISGGVGAAGRPDS